MFPTIPFENTRNLDRAEFVQQDLNRLRRSVDAIAEVLQLEAAAKDPDAIDDTRCEEVEFSKLGLTYALQFLMREQQRVEGRLQDVLDNLLEIARDKEKTRDRGLAETGATPIRREG